MNNVDGRDLFNTLSLRESWKKCIPFLENFCTDFIHWKNQPDFQFGLVPLTNLVVPDDSSYGGGGVLSDPIQQHFAVKVSGLPNFMGTRISLWSQLNISKWNFFRNYWVDS